eukprot:m.24465 g.24465  ORF g.24465 m.24465 type:complete len:110 (+) comp14615_c0_seq1:1494-1823(+)
MIMIIILIMLVIAVAVIMIVVVVVVSSASASDDENFRLDHRHFYSSRRHQPLTIIDLAALATVADCSAACFIIFIPAIKYDAGSVVVRIGLDMLAHSDFHLHLHLPSYQ